MMWGTTHLTWRLPVAAQEREKHESGMYAVALGTAGGPKWWGRSGFDAGTATAVVVDGAVYLVDFGYGAGRQVRKAGLEFSDVRALFVTHMHSDHTVDLPGLLLFSHRDVQRIEIHGPGDRGKLAPLTEQATNEPEVIDPHDPTPGIKETIRRLFSAYAHDLNDRARDYGSEPQTAKFPAFDIEIPAHLGFDPDTNVAPPMDPFTVYEDERVIVSAILVDHHPTAPAFAYRFDSKHGSVVISGDTGYCDNTIRIAQGCDILFHEVISLAPIRARTETELGDPLLVQAVMEHHERAHTTPADAGRIAQLAGARKLVLHHFAPASAPRADWMEAGVHFEGELIIARDLDEIAVDSEGHRAASNPRGSLLNDQSDHSSVRVLSSDR